jgi:hypothetical protein
VRVTRNDYNLNLMNGDVGLCLPTSLDLAPTKSSLLPQVPAVAIVANDLSPEKFAIPRLIQFFANFGFTPIRWPTAGAKLKMTRINFLLRLVTT